jgi:N6-L-threonylcarbamoyladenine synthase
MPVPRRLLCVETSCDETSVAVIDEGGRALADVVRSQIEAHVPWGGVIPELASRMHLEWLPAVVDEALRASGTAPGEVDGVAVTRGPGLAGCLLVGLSWAQGFAAARGLPILGVNHLEGHLLAPFVGEPAPPFPFVGLVVSGGHSSVVFARSLGDYEVLGETVDDAAGEAFDKGARLLGLPYPGGVMIDRLAQGGDTKAIPLPRALRGDTLDLSFSGLKTAVRERVEAGGAPQGSALADFCASLQEAIVDVLVDRARRAARRTGAGTVVLTGGVAANSRLRGRMEEAAREDGLRLLRPTPSRCTDNAAMVGYAAHLHWPEGVPPPERLDIDPSFPLGIRRPL